MTEYSVEKFYNEYALKKEDTIIAVIDTGINTRKVCDLLNEQSKQIAELKERNQRQYNRLKEITDLMFKRDWKTLENMVDDWEKADELLKKEWGTIL